MKTDDDLKAEIARLIADVHEEQLEKYLAIQAEQWVQCFRARVLQVLSHPAMRN